LPLSPFAAIEKDYIGTDLDGDGSDIPLRRGETAPCAKKYDSHATLLAS
jgi:hypothetical protein